jgi:hypothetical protein
VYLTILVYDNKVGHDIFYFLSFILLITINLEI